MSKFRIVLLLLFIGNLVLGFLLYRSYSERTYLMNELENKKPYVESLKSNLDEEKKLTNDNHAKIAELNKNVIKLEAELADAKNNLAASKKNAEQATRDENQKLKEQMNKLLSDVDSLAKNLRSELPFDIQEISPDEPKSK